jgi:hypothetical protein
VRTNVGQSARTAYGAGDRHSNSRYGRWARYGLDGYARTGESYGSDSYSSSSDGCSYVYGYRRGTYGRVLVCSDN